MFFENDAITFTISNVIKLKQKNVNFYNTGRNFCALSFRICSDTVLKTDTDKYFAADNSVSFLPAGLNYERISKYDEMIIIHFSIINGYFNKIEIFNPKQPEIVKKLFENILECWDKKVIGYKYRCSALLSEILAICYSQNYKPQNTTSKIQKSVDFLLNHFKDTELSINEIASKSFMSEVYFRKLFKAEYGISPQKYITNLRIQNSLNLISMGYYSLKEVAEMSGFADYKYFSVTFKKKMGISPSKYIE